MGWSVLYVENSKIMGKEMTTHAFQKALDDGLLETMGAVFVNTGLQAKLQWLFVFSLSGFCF